MPSESHTLHRSRPASLLPGNVRAWLERPRYSFLPISLLRFASLRSGAPHSTAFEERIASAKSRVENFTPLEAAELVGESEARLLDIREHKEFAHIRIRGAIHLRRAAIEATVSHYFPDRKAQLICYCNDGTWSALAADTLRSMGYSQAGFMIGGLRHWIREELPVVRQEVFDE